MGMDVFLQAEPQIPGAHKIGTAISSWKVNLLCALLHPSSLAL